MQSYLRSQNSISELHVDVIYLYDKSTSRPVFWSRLDHMILSVGSVLQYMTDINRIKIITTAEEQDQVIEALSTLRDEKVLSMIDIHIMETKTPAWEFKILQLPQIADYLLLMPDQIKLNHYWSAQECFHFHKLQVNQGYWIPHIVVQKQKYLSSINPTHPISIRYQITAHVLNECLSEDHLRTIPYWQLPIPLSLFFIRFAHDHIQMGEKIYALDLDPVSLFVHIGHYIDRAILTYPQQSTSINTETKSISIHRR
jgi:hypothetical protein